MGVNVVRELYGVMTAEGAVGGFLVTSGRFTTEAVAFVNGKQIELIDGVTLQPFLSEGKHAGNPRADRQAPAVGATAPPEPQPVRGSESSAGNDSHGGTRCPHCGGDMVMRRPRANAANASPFWGCSKFKTGYRGTRPGT